MAVVVTPTSLAILEVFVPRCVLPTDKGRSTQTCASTTRLPSQTAALRTWLQLVIGETFSPTPRINSTTSSNATMRSSRTIRTCLMPVFRCPRAWPLRRMIRVKFLETRPRRSRNSIKIECTAPAPASATMCTTTRSRMCTPLWKLTSPRITALKSPGTRSTCESKAF